MSRARRGLGSNRRTHRTPSVDLPSAVGSLIRSALEQVGVVKDVALKQAMSSRVRFDALMDERRRRDVLARLGEAVYELAGRGELGEIAEHPDLAELFAELASLDQAADEAYEDDGYRGEEDDREPVSSADWKPPKPRGQAEELRVWRPVMSDTPEGSYISTPVRPASASKPKEPSTERHEPPSAEQRDAGGRRGRGSQRGGIVFVSDDVGPGSGEEEDLSEYMNEDDVPKRGTAPDRDRDK